MMDRPTSGGAYVRDAKTGALKKAGTDEPAKSTGSKSNKVPSTKAKPSGEAAKEGN